MKNSKIAIDGYSSTGKSTFAKMIAAKYGLVYVDTGAIYRAVTLAAIKNRLKEPFGADKEEMSLLLSRIEIHFEKQEYGFSRIFLDGVDVESDIRTMPVSDRVSIIAALPEVRGFVNSLLKEFGQKEGVVMDGRDIGTVVMPDADIKIFMTASDEVRAQRRFEEMRAKGNQKVTFEEVLSNLHKRDTIDSGRKADPLRKADDAIELDNSNMTLEDQMVWVDSLLK